MIQSSACQPWLVDLPGLAGEYGGLVGTYTISWDTIRLRAPSLTFLSLDTKNYIILSYA